MRKLLVISLILLAYCSANSQYLSLFNIDTSEYPNIKANFFAFDAAWNQQSPDKNMLFINEDGIPRTILNVTCPSPKTPAIISSVLVMDVSNSVNGRNLDIIKAAAQAWINGLPLNKSECAITSFDHNNYFNQSFTTDRNKLSAAINDLTAGEGTDYNKALIDSMCGGLRASKSGKYQRVIVMLTDGLSSSVTNVTKIVDLAKQQNCKIFVVTLDLACPKELKDISTQTGGQWFENVADINKAIEVYRTILNFAKGGEPCSISWNSSPNCDLLNTTIELSWNVKKATSFYPIPTTGFHHLDIKPNNIAFGQVQPGATKDTTIKIKANDVDFQIIAINLKFGSTVYKIENISLPFTILKNTSYDLKVSYSPIDSNICYTGFEIITDYCPASFSCNGGFEGKAMKQPTLKLTRPNGGELFVAGVDTLITWEGIMPSDFVTLEYSIDNGNNWLTLANRVCGLKYLWKNVPKLSSNRCLIRISNFVSTIPVIEWQKSIGGSKDDTPKFIIQTEEGDYFVLGSSNSTDGDIIGNKGAHDFLIAKLSQTGTLENTKNYGGNKGDELTAMCSTSDGGYIVVGETWSTDGDITINKGYIDCLIIKYNNLGIVEWRKTYGGSGYEKMNTIKQTKDGGYILTGYTGSRDGDIINYVDGGDIWVIKLSSEGSIEWTNSLGGSALEIADNIEQITDGGYLVYGGSGSNDGDVTCNPQKNGISWIVKLNSSGSIVWDKVDTNDLMLLRTDDGGSVNINSDDNYLVKLSSSNDIEWKTTYRESNYDHLTSIIQTKDSGYLLIGTKKLYIIDGWQTIAHDDYWLVKISSFGALEWQKTLGGSKSENSYSVVQTSDNGFIIAGMSNSSDGDVTVNKGLSDYWVVKLSGDNLNVLQNDQSDAVFSIITPIANASDIDMKKCLLGNVKDSTITNFIQNTGSCKFVVDSIYFQGTDAGAFSFVSAFPKYSVSAGSYHQGEIRFIPTKSGNHQAELVIITQSDTLIQRIIGEGVKPQIKIENNIIDFGIIDIGYQRDTLNVLTIKNIGTTPLNITKTIHNKPNKIDFTTISGGGSFTLMPNESRTMNLRFKPSETGLTSGMLEFYYEGVGSPAGVQLFGEGGVKCPQILATANKFSDLICEQSALSSVEIKNIGGKPLIINEINLKGNNPDDFSVTKVLPITIEPDSSKTINVIFKPLSSGIKTVDIEFKSNASPDSILTIPISVNKDSVSIVPEFINIDLGVLCPYETKDTLIVLKNLGTIADVGFVNLSSNLSSSVSAFKINPDSTFQLPITFIGSQNNSAFSEIVSITDSVCGREQEVIISGTILKPVITTQDITVSAIIGLSNNGKIVLINNSKRDFSITNVVGMEIPFELSGNPFPIEVKANTKAELIIKYSPVDANGSSINLTFNGEPCNISHDVYINGTIAKFLLIYPANTQTGLEQKINFKWLSAIGVKYYQLQISKNDQFTDLVYSKDSLTTTEHFVQDLEPDILYYWRVRVWNDESIGSDIWSEVWTFRTGTSSVNIKPTKIKIIPNPAGDFITIYLGAINPMLKHGIDTATAIQIYNTLGEKVISESIHPMTGSHRMNIESLPKGIYFVKAGGEVAKFVKL